MFTRVFCTIYYEVEKGGNNNWLKFKCSCPKMSVSNYYYISFCGTEIIHSLSLNEEQHKNLLNILSLDFGFAPYDISDAKKILEKAKSYDV